MSSPVPSFDTLDKIYDPTAVPKQDKRYKHLIAEFEKVHGRKVDFIVRSPGRVNLIGEHIDYCGFGVLPMAIERDVIIAGSVTDEDTKVRIANVNSAKYPAREFDYEGKENIVTIDSTKLEWSNYFKCGYKGMLGKFQLDKPKGLFLLVDGTVPAGGGLSSSAAFVCASALAVVTANKLSISKTELTEIAIVAERNVGVNSGGMDQSASVLSEKDFALRVEFVPNLHTKPVPLPSTNPKLAFVIANTLVTADKFVTAPRNYNLRVVETRMAALFLAKALNLPAVDSLKEVYDTYYKDSSLNEVERFTDLLNKALEKFPQDSTGGNGYTLEEVSEMTGMPVQEIQEKYMTRFPVVTDYYRLVHRTKHVLSEASRVIEFHKACESSDGDSTLKALGDLMNESQESCDKMFMCSCPEINDVCELARKNGAFGSRLSGAGWGGSTVHLTTEDNVSRLIEVFKNEFYRKVYPDITEEQLDDAIIATKPCSGAAIFTGF
ncbi:Galactokinase [Choanephora cucurbitarum]|uniref:Galactokinase n=1 Tax=Choanephora cucurbitarum TaxID=101091 RepID=A0A1C7NIP4_9FUNG|nr:Galactokinase [Choanephora cucurbitarum]